MSKILEIFKTMEYGPAPEAPDAVKAWLDEHNRKLITPEMEKRINQAKQDIISGKATVVDYRERNTCPV